MKMVRALHGLIILSSVMCIAYCQDVVRITTSKSPVYNGESVMLTCVFDGQDAAILSVTLYAFKETREVATLFTRTVVTSQTSIGTGLFSGYSFTGYDTVANKGPRLSVSIDASPSWELDYRCTFSVFEENLNARVNLTSNFFSLSVWVLPKVPSLLPSLLVFNETDNISLDCSSLGGTPVGVIDLVVLPQTSGDSLQTNGSISVSLKLPGPTKGWHNAQVTCRVKNHDFPNMTTRDVIRVNHIAVLGDSSLTVNTYSTSQPLDCSVHVRSFPGATYLWSVPLIANYSQWAYLSSPVLTVQAGQLGLFNCTVTNNLTGKAEVITFNLISVNPLPLAWIIAAAVVGSVILIIIVLVVLYKRGCLSKVVTRGDHSSTNCNNIRSRDENEMHDSKSRSKSRPSYSEVGRVADDDGVVKESLIRGAQPTDDAACSEHSRLKPQLNTSDSRILIAAEGVVANLKQKTLPTTILVTYPDRSCSLEGILVQVGQAIPLLAFPSFKSVGLLLRRLKTGLSISEVDRAVLTSRSVTGESGDTLRDFVARLANMCLNKKSGDTRIDILNYGGTDAAQLTKELEDLLKVSVTVSSDPFGFGETISPHAPMHSAVGADYFNRRKVDEVVYADVSVADSPLRSQPIKEGDHVMYSEIARNV